jgi:hypothetical protein
MRERVKSPINLEMLNLVAATEPMKHEPGQLTYPSYNGAPTTCGLDHYITADGKREVFILTELPTSQGTSITNRAEVVAEEIENLYQLGHVFEADGNAGRPKFPEAVYIEHYPRSKKRGDFDENFSVVTFKGKASFPFGHNASYYGDPNWIAVEREQVERLIGQEFEPDRNYDEQ